MWSKMKLGEVLKNREGRYKPNDPIIAGLKRIDKINFSGQIFLSDKSSNTDMILIKKGDLVISGINVEKGALAVYEGEEDVLATIHYSSYIFDTGKIDIDFLKVFLKSPDFVQLLKEQVPGGIKTEIKPKHILPLEVYFPEKLSDQKAIAQHFFGRETMFNQLNEHISHQLTLLENLNQAILQEAVQGKLVPQSPNDEPASELLKRIKEEKLNRHAVSTRAKKIKELPPIKPEEIPFEIPENWVWCRLGEICTKVTDGFHHTPKKLSEGKIYISATHIRDGGIKWDECLFISEIDHNDLYKKASPQKGEILITNRGAGCGTPVIIDIDDEFSFQNAALIGFNQELICNKFLFYFILKSRSEIMETFVNGGLQPMLSNVVLSTIPIPLPPLSEQKRIVAEIEKQFALTQQLKEKVLANQQATEQLLKALLHQAFEVKEQ